MQTPEFKFFEAVCGRCRLPLLCAALVLSGCAWRTAVIHDGVDAVVVDADTKRPVPDAFVFDRIEGGVPRVLAQSDEVGHLALDPKSRTELIFAVPMMGEALVTQELWICKAGYRAKLVSRRAGWNADYRTPESNRLGNVELTMADTPGLARCVSDVRDKTAGPSR